MLGVVEDLEAARDRRDRVGARIAGAVVAREPGERAARDLDPQPVASPEELRALGYELVDEDDYWRLWRIPHEN